MANRTWNPHLRLGSGPIKKIITEKRLLKLNWSRIHFQSHLLIGNSSHDEDGRVRMIFIFNHAIHRCNLCEDCHWLWVVHDIDFLRREIAGVFSYHRLFENSNWKVSGQLLILLKIHSNFQVNEYYFAFFTFLNIQGKVDQYQQFHLKKVHQICIC